MAGSNQTSRGAGFNVVVMRIRKALTIGGTGGAASAGSSTTVTKNVTAFTDAVAKDVFTVTVPNAAHTAVIEVDALGVLGAGGAVGAGESSRTSKYQLVITRTAGLAGVATLSALIGGANSKVAGADNITSVVVTASAMTGANSATQTFTIQLTITKAAGASAAHTCVARATLLNQNITGISIA